MLHDPARMALIMGGLSAFTPAGFAGGFQQGMQNYQHQQSAELSAKRLEQEANFHQDQYNRETLAQRNQREMLERQYEMSKVPPGYRRTDAGNYEPVQGGPADPAQIQREAMAKRLPAMSREDMDPLVDAYLAGDHSVMNGIGRGTQGPQNIEQFWNMTAERLRSQGKTGNEIAASKANFMAESAAARTAATREANISSAVHEAEMTFPQVLQASAALPRTNWTPVNAALNFYRQKSGSPEQRTFGAAIQAAITAYSQAISRTGGNTVFAQQHAEDLLNKADGHAAIEATIKQLQTEMKIAQAAPEQTRQEILNRILGIGPQGGAAGAAPPAGGGAPAAAAFKPPPNAVARKDASGKTWYYDPDTRNPYQGQ
jgi:hypothetical protein